MTLEEARMKGARAKKPRASFPQGWDKKKIVETYNGPDVLVKKLWIEEWNSKYTLKLTRDKINRWERELKAEQ